MLDKIKQRLSAKRVLAFIALVSLIGLGFKGVTHAQSITQGYGTDETLQRGIIVNQKKDDPKKVERLNSENIEHMLGVTVNANDSPITLSADGQKAYVATVGKYDVLVTTQNGTIKTGDYISISAIEGLGMKADEKEPLALGKALADFDGKGNVLSTGTVKDATGKDATVSIGRILVDINIGKNPLAKNDAAVPAFLKKASEAIAGKQVSAGRVYTSIVIFMITSMIAGAVLYAGIRSSIIAVGRNPLGRKGIMKSLIQVIITSFIIFIIGIIGVYLLLKV
jgi:hypothetical protein